MIKASMQTGDSTVIVLGLTVENCSRLLKGQPIVINGPELGNPHDILLVGGKDEKAIMELLQDSVRDKGGESVVYTCCAKHAAEQGRPHIPAPEVVCPDDLSGLS